MLNPFFPCPPARLFPLLSRLQRFVFYDCWSLLCSEITHFGEIIQHVFTCLFPFWLFFFLILHCFVSQPSFLFLRMVTYLFFFFFCSQVVFRCMDCASLASYPAMMESFGKPSSILLPLLVVAVPVANWHDGYLAVALNSL